MENAVAVHLKLHEKEYTDNKALRIFIGTWNVNGQSAHNTPINLWLCCDPFPPDVYAIGFQELDLSKEAYIFNDPTKEQEWLHLCHRSLHHKAKYVLIKLVRLVGMMLIVFVKEELKQHVTEVHSEVVGTGLMGKMGNKGAVAIRLDLHNSSICFVNSHLAAHVEEYRRRNQDFNEIWSRMIFNQFQPPKYIKDHDHIYWLGDLNYRIDDMGTDEIKARVEEGSFDKILLYDQLRKQMLHNRVFQDFQEPPIKHPPTYKYNPGTNVWDTSEKNRPPAWCDRILYRGGPTIPILYRSHNKLLLSDHKPVSCLFQAHVKHINVERFTEVYKKIMKNLDKQENESLPQATLSKIHLVFDNVSPTEPSIDTMTVTNTGQVPVSFRFKPRPGSSAYCQPWLQVSPLTGALGPGDNIEIEFRIFIGNNPELDTQAGPGAARNASSGPLAKLEDILILHLDRGKDFFITVNVGMLKQQPADDDQPLIQF